MIIRVIRPLLVLSVTVIFTITSISCSAEGVSLEEFSGLSTQLQATENQLKELQIKLADSEFRVTQYENTLRQYTTIVDADYPNLLKRVEQARLIMEMITVSASYQQGLVTDSEMMSVIANVEKIDSTVVKEGVIQMMADGSIMNEDEAGELVTSWLNEVHRLLQ
ncbi:MAG: hypothetical protein FI698_02400 [SAR202 cluster bacterium]|nr:hypothetical protein [SAR202 cluster bacterium]|tara:strand:+ start:36511 stop:37005 length:495 start_codon:yes stop_codon:yes gene_type:complete